MSTKQRYDEDFKRTLVELYHNGKTQASLIKEYGVSQTALTRWIKQYSTVETDDGEVLKVNRSTYYKHFYSDPAPRTEENQVIRKHILQIYTDYDNSLGAYNIRLVLERDYGINISLGRVYRLMNMNLPKRSTEKPKRKDNGPCINHLNQQFNPASPNSVWASDFTDIKVNGSFHYLCVVIDLFSRKVIGWSLSNRHNVDLTIKAFEKAYFDRGEPDYVLFHSDQGSEYTAFTFRQTLEKCNAVQSFSKKGYPYDNACCESFFRHMKCECINRNSFRNQDELRLCCFEYINRYNSKRPHSSLGE